MATVTFIRYKSQSAGALHAEDGLVVVDRSIDRARGLLDVGQLVEVAHARGGQHCACRQQGEAERMEYLFHHRYLLLR